MATPPFSQKQYQPVLPMGIPTFPRKSNIRIPRTTLDTPRQRGINVRESNWRQGRSSIQNTPDILKRETVD